jgi:RimJ/RimL family protein N-acetyltransferase
MQTAPTLETPRLRMRAHTLADYEASCSLWSDPDVVRHIGGKPNTPEEVWSRLLRYIGHWSALGFGYWVVEELSTGRVIGEVGLSDYHRDIDPAFAALPEIGWVLTPSAHGHGYATEAGTAAIAWATAHLATPELTCLIAPDNAASLRVAAKVGFTERTTTLYRDHPTIILTKPLSR